MADSAVAIQDLRFAYGNHPPVLDIANLEIKAKEKVFIFGPSGCGKSTLLGLLSGILEAKTGVLSILGNDIRKFSRTERDHFRGQHIGYIFQMFNLIPYLSVEENISLPCFLNAKRRERLKGRSCSEASVRLANDLDIGSYLQTPVTSLSVGQQQRVACARALIATPEIVIADEPTSALDSDRRVNFINLLFREVTKANATLIFVSHDRELGKLFDRVIELPQLNRVKRA